MIIFTLLSVFFFGNNDDNLFPRFKLKKGDSTIDNGYWRQYRICHEPFNWSVPNGLKGEYLRLFWVQPENHRHFYDTNNTNHCGIVRIVYNGMIVLPFPHISNVTHLINARIAPRKNNHPQDDILLVFSGHFGHYFQHFFDNVGPAISIVRSVLGESITDLNIAVDTDLMFSNVPKLWKRLGFSNVTSTRKGQIYSASYLIYVENVPRLHPAYFEDLRAMLRLPQRNPELIIWCSRRMTNSYYNQRFVTNEDSVLKMLKRRFGSRLVVFDHSERTLEETIDLFARAKAIIGSHGGALYNQFFAPEGTIVVELLPIQRSGLYHDQSNPNEEPSFSHMAVWSNTLLLKQQFWRYYQISRKSNYAVDVKEFEKFLLGIPDLFPQENDDL